MKKNLPLLFFIFKKPTYIRSLGLSNINKKSTLSFKQGCSSFLFLSTWLLKFWARKIWNSTNNNTWFKHKHIKLWSDRRLRTYKYYYNGLGYKIFVRNGHLFVWIGLTHYTIIPIPSVIKVVAKKRRVYFVSVLSVKLNDFLSKIRRIRKIDIYKGKGLSEIRSYRGFIKMKSGKKKQY